MSVSLTDNGLLIDGREVPVYSGTINYWRLARERWAAILDQAQALGFGMVETYIPWSVHETAPGEYDWGQHDARKDVEAFMRLCDERGMWLLVRPGPLINAELTDFGFPEWVLLDPAVQAHTAVGSLHLDAAWGLHPPRPFPVPSYASEAFFRYAAGWFDAICPIIARHLAPAGCVVAVQSDNETCYLFHDQTYATDYSPDSLALYRRFLADSYQQIDALNELYSTEYDDFDGVEPPRECLITGRAEVPWHLDWVRYKEHQIVWSVSRIARMLRERGIAGVPIFHDIAFQQRTPLDVAAMENDSQIDWVGTNLYRNKEGYAAAVQHIRYMVGTTRLPFVPEFGCGIWSHHPQTPMPEDHELITLGALMHGLKAFNLYMLAERERWQGSAITRHGELRPEYAGFYRRLNDFLQHYQLWRFQRERRVLVLRNYDLGRFEAMTSTLGYAHADLLGLPWELFFSDADLRLRWDAAAEADEYRDDTWFGTLLRSLRECSLDYDLADTHLSAERLARYPRIWLPATDFMALDDQWRIVEYLQSGGQVIVGPGLPYTDPTMREAGLLGQYLAAPGTATVGQGQLTWASKEDIPGLVGELAAQSAYSIDDPAIDLAVLRHERTALVYVANPTADARSATLHFAGQRCFRPAWGGAASLRGECEVRVALPAYGVQIWEVVEE